MGNKNSHTIELEYSWFAKELRRLREEMGISQDKMAEALGVGRTSIADIERCGSGVSWPRILRIAYFLEMDLNQFVEEFSHSEAAKQLMGTARQIMIQRIEEQKKALQDSLIALAEFDQANSA